MIGVLGVPVTTPRLARGPRTLVWKPAAASAESGTCLEMGQTVRLGSISLIEALVFPESRNSHITKEGCWWVASVLE